MAYENVIQTVWKCVLGDSLRISTYTHVFTLFLCRPRAKFRPRLHLIREVSRSHTNKHIRTPGMSTLYKWSARSWCPYIWSTNQTQWTNIQALIGLRISAPTTTQPNQQDRQLLIFCILNSLFLNTLSSYDVINSFILSTQIFRLNVLKECKISWDFSVNTVGLSNYYSRPFLYFDYLPSVIL